MNTNEQLYNMAMEHKDTLLALWNATPRRVREQRGVAFDMYKSCTGDTIGSCPISRARLILGKWTTPCVDTLIKLVAIIDPELVFEALL